MQGSLGGTRGFGSSRRSPPLPGPQGDSAGVRLLPCAAARKSG